MSEALKPCPFCGGEASSSGVGRVNRPEAIWADGTFVVQAFFCNCMNCGVNNMGIVGGYQTQVEAIAAWNTRTDPTRDRLVAALVFSKGALLLADKHQPCSIFKNTILEIESSVRDAGEEV